MKYLPILAMLGAACLPVLGAHPAHAQATRTWVSNGGDDLNPCSFTAPCKTFAGAISKTAINGEINCLDSGGYGPVQIAKSITIDCHDVFASILAGGTNPTVGIIVNIAAGNANDPLRTVRIRNVSITGTGLNGTVGTRVGINGIFILQAAAVFIEDVLITDFTQIGIRDFRNSSGPLVIRNTVVRNNGSIGIQVAPTTGSAVSATIDNSHSNLNAHGLVVANGSKAIVNRSVFSGNTGFGIDSEPGSEINVNESVSSFNGVGLQASGIARLSNSDIVFNQTGLAGTPSSFGNNRVSGNATAGATPTPMGAVAEATGQE